MCAQHSYGFIKTQRTTERSKLNPSFPTKIHFHDGIISRFRWTGLNHLKHKDEQQLMSLSSSAIPFMILLQENLTTCQEKMHRVLFNKHWQQVVLSLDELVFYMVMICVTAGTFFALTAL